MKETQKKTRTARARAGLTVALAASLVVGAAVISAALMISRRHPAPAVSEDYGRRLLTETSALLGPDQPDPEMRYTGSRLQCGSCHLKAGTDPGTLSLVEAFQKYPRVSGRDGGLSDIKQRLNGCMTRSMNGRALPLDSVEMNSMAAYLKALNEQYAVTSASRRAAHEPKAFATPDRAADPAAGKLVYDNRCALCHGNDGLGLSAQNGALAGYVFPPLWGPDSFNDGAGTHRVLTASRFIKARMPLGKPDLSDDEAFDVAAYINVQPRPHMENLDKDYPDRSTKPVDNPYGPYADSFPQEQHKLGPFKPIEQFYAKLKGGK